MVTLFVIVGIILVVFAVIGMIESFVLVTSTVFPWVVVVSVLTCVIGVFAFPAIRRRFTDNTGLVFTLTMIAVAITLAALSGWVVTPAPIAETATDFWGVKTPAISSTRLQLAIIKCSLPSALVLAFPLLKVCRTLENSK